MFDPEKAVKKMLGPGVKTPKFGKPNSADLDGDGIPNLMDCQPKNMFRQDGETFRLKGKYRILWLLPGKVLSDTSGEGHLPLQPGDLYYITKQTYDDIGMEEWEPEKYKKLKVNIKKIVTLGENNKIFNIREIKYGCHIADIYNGNKLLPHKIIVNSSHWMKKLDNQYEKI